MFLNKQNTFLQHQESKLNATLHLQKLKKQYQQLFFEYQNQSLQHHDQIQNHYTQLQKQNKEWEDNYLIISPITGDISFFYEPSLYQQVSPSQELLTIIPDKKEVYAYAQIPTKYIGKLEVGKKAKIKLEAYPVMRYGWLSGEIAAISLSPQDNQYAVRISLNEGLKTSENVQIPPQTELKGVSEITLEERSLLEKFLEQLRYSVELIEDGSV